MDTSDLRSFIQVCQDGSLTKASKSLFITPQGLSKTIKNLEQELKTPLFYRTPNGLAQTEYGELLFKKAQHIINELEEIENSFYDLANLKGEIKLASSYGVIAAFTPNFLFDFRKKYPNINLKWWEFSDFKAEEEVYNGESDFGLIKGPIPEDRFDSKILASYKSMIIVPANHHLADKDYIDIIDLKDENIILESREFKIFHNFTHICEKAGFTPNIIFETTELSLAHKLCQQGMGVAVTVNFAVEDMPMSNVKAIHFREEVLPWDVYFVTKKGIKKNAMVKCFEDFITEYVDVHLK